MGLFTGLFGGSGDNPNAYRPLFGSGGAYDDQRKPAGTQYIINGQPYNNEQEVKDAINRGSYSGSLGYTCPCCGVYYPDKASMLNCLCRNR